MAQRIKHADDCDSTSKYQDIAINRSDSILRGQEERYNNLSKLSLTYQKQRDKDRKKLILFKKFQFIGFPLVGLGAFYLGYTFSK